MIEIQWDLDLIPHVTCIGIRDMLAKAVRDLFLPPFASLRFVYSCTIAFCAPVVTLTKDHCWRAFFRSLFRRTFHTHNESQTKMLPCAKVAWQAHLHTNICANAVEETPEHIRSPTHHNSNTELSTVFASTHIQAYSSHLST